MSRISVAGELRKSRNPSEPIPLYSSKGPVYLLVEVQLSKPFYPKIETPEIEKRLLEVLPSKRMFEEPVSESIERINYKTCIKNLANILEKSYTDFKKLDYGVKSPLQYDEENHFTKYLQDSGLYNMLMEKLQVPVTSYVSKIISNTPWDKQTLFQKFTPIYTALIEEMHLIVSMGDITSRTTLKSKRPNIDSDQLLLMAAEMCAQQDYNKCLKYLLQRLEKDTTNPDYWLDIAVPLLNFKNDNAALEMVKEALILDNKHRDGLILLGGISLLNGDMDSAELAFTAVTRYYPKFAEGWLILYIFFNLAGKTGGADISKVTALKCERARREPIEQCMANFPILSWNNLFCYNGEDLFLRTIIYLLSLNLCALTENCLEEMFMIIGRDSPIYNYYLAACYYQQRHYSDSLTILEVLTENCWNIRENSMVSCLKGNVYYRMCEKQLAKDAYDLAVTTTKNPDHISMPIAYIRLGFFNLDQENYEFAFKLFYQAVRTNPTGLGWLGLAIASFHLKKYNDAELALTEANILDPECWHTWVYLALINFRNHNVNIFHQCVDTAIKKGLQGRLRVILQKLCKLAVESPD